jgi:hypothetical protein
MDPPDRKDFSTLEITTQVQRAHEAGNKLRAVNAKQHKCQVISEAWEGVLYVNNSLDIAASFRKTQMNIQRDCEDLVPRFQEWLRKVMEDNSFLQPTPTPKHKPSWRKFFDDVLYKSFTGHMCQEEIEDEEHIERMKKDAIHASMEAQKLIIPVIQKKLGEAHADYRNYKMDIQECIFDSFMNDIIYHGLGSHGLRCQWDFMFKSQQFQKIGERINGLYEKYKKTHQESSRKLPRPKIKGGARRYNPF